MDGQEPIMIFGRVTGGGGGPVPGAAVTLCDLSGDQLDRTATDEAGRYQLVPPTGGTYLVICSSAHRRPRASLVALTDRPELHDVALEGGGATLRGTVTVGPAGSPPAADVVLTLTDVRGTVVAVARSGADGAYALADLPEGDYTLTAAAPGVAPVAATVSVATDGAVTHDVALAAHSTLTGVVRSATGDRPVAEALATLVGADGTVLGSTVTGEDGAFRFPAVPDGVYTVTASGYAPVASEVEVGPGHAPEVELVLTPPVVDAGDGADSPGPAAAPDPSPVPPATDGSTPPGGTPRADGAAGRHEGAPGGWFSTAGHGSGNGAVGRTAPPAADGDRR